METVNLTWKPHPTQWKIHNSLARFKIVDAGRRWGKTRYAWMELLLKAWQKKGLYWWVAPVYKELMPISQTIRETTPKEIIRKSYQMQNRYTYLELMNGSEIYFHNASTEDSLRGSGLDGLVIDEAASLKGQRYEEELRPSLMDTLGWLIAIGTPKGRNWFYNIWMRGQDREAWPEYESWKYSSYENITEKGGYLEKSEIDSIAKELPELVYRQEILADFLKGEGVVFRNIDNLLMGATGAKEEGRYYVTGCDLAKTQDFTVLVAMDDQGHVRGFDRFRQLDWEFQKLRIKSFVSQYPGTLLIDSTGVGDPIYDSLFRDGVRIRGFKFTSESKRKLIENLSILCDQTRITIPEDLTILINELKAYSYEILPSGNVRYGAPETMHDDAATALALAGWGIFASNIGGEIQVESGWRPRGRKKR